MWIPLSYFFLYRFYQSLTTGKCEQQEFTPAFCDTITSTLVLDMDTTYNIKIVSLMPQIIKVGGRQFSKREQLRTNLSGNTIALYAKEGVCSICAMLKACLATLSVIWSTSTKEFLQPFHAIYISMQHCTSHSVAITPASILASSTSKPHQLLYVECQMSKLLYYIKNVG